MYAVIASGGKQYKVEEGETIRVEKLPQPVGEAVLLDKVLAFSDGETLKIGQPTLQDVGVHAHVVEQGKGKKIVVFKFKRRKRYRRKKGHRQPYTALRIEKIESSSAMVEGSQDASAQDASLQAQGETM